MPSPGSWVLASLGNLCQGLNRKEFLHHVPSNPTLWQWEAISPCPILPDPCPKSLQLSLGTVTLRSPWVFLSSRLNIPSCPSLSPQEMRFVSWLTCTTSPAALGFPCDGVVPLAVPCAAGLPFSKMNSTLLVLGCCLSFHSSVCPSAAQLPLLVPLTPFPGSLKLQLPTLSGGSAVSYSVLNCFLVSGVSRLGSCSPVRVWCFRASKDTVLQLDLLLRLFLCLGTLDELCVPLEQGCLRRLFLCRSGFVLSATSTCCQVGLSQDHSGKGLLSTSHCLCAGSVLGRVTPD
ncbi:LOW QUALITY PROTEIN: uncharacterized protein LOC131577039 [Poecile atricapillus]|uniref:LOW QUALITY PROTEIN: uncharacterized protein LOC131577039 n=1 Tax=Poecile atricapillus TaxID=48891 RepID=UPI0027395C73|nr:LOW QUALITY PROTEIN: uncharacterized protein LOC131577039 [Poecile atricapillus]